MIKMSFQNLRFGNWEIKFHLFSSMVNCYTFKWNLFEILTILLEGGKDNLRSRAPTDLIESMK